MSPSTSQFRFPLMVLAFVLSIVVPLAWYYVFLDVPTFDDEQALGSHLGFFLLINLNIIVVMVLGFLVVKNLVKLLLDRKRRILGSRLRTRLVTAFVGLSLIPTVLLFLMAKGILERVVQGWFSPQVVTSVDGAFRVSEHLYDQTEAEMRRYVGHLGGEFETLLDYVVPVGERTALDGEALAVLAGYLEAKRAEYGVFDLSLLDAEGETVLSARRADVAPGTVELPGVNKRSLQRALRGEASVAPEQSINGEFMRGYAPLRTSRAADADVPFALLATAWISPELNDTLSQIITAYDDYRELWNYRRPIASSYILSLVVVTLLIVFAAVWVGFYLARSLSVPIQLVAEGTQEVAQGNLTHRIADVGDDELSILVGSFNKMTEDLQQTTGELVSRRRYMEAVLTNVGVGVISVDKLRRAMTLNVAAREILGRAAGRESEVGQRLEDFLPEPLVGQLHALFDALFDSDERVATANVSQSIDSMPKELQVTVTKLVDETGALLGGVVLLDDVTELVSAQRMAAWREVARRIAHEIKNPLTPIQLSAQRVQRRFGGERRGAQVMSEKDREVISEASEMIISQVETLRILVNEFSRFARMPKANPRPTDLNSLLSETVALYRDTHTDIEFEISLDELVPEIELDREQIGRVLINLIDNAVDSVRTRRDGLDGDAARTFDKTGVGQLLKKFRFDLGSTNGFSGKIELRSTFDEALELVSIVVSDNGIGIAEEDIQRLFEPYFSTKKDSRGGTGLGLAIVNTIIADHNGFVRVKNNDDGGARFVLELPVTRPQLLRQAAH